MNKEYYDYLNILASEGMCDSFSTPYNKQNARKIDENYIYRPKNVFFKSFRFTLKLVLLALGPIVNRFAFKIKIYGRKNLKGVKSGITFSNHVHHLDALCNIQAMRGKNFFFTGADHNMKKGFAGRILRAGGLLPLSDSYKASKNLNKEISAIVKKKGFVHFYPEQALWFRYENSRPLKNGAFYHATINDVPVIPIVILFRQRKGLEKVFRRKKCVVVKICKPIYPNKELNEKDRIILLRETAQTVYDNTINEFYKNYAIKKST